MPAPRENPAAREARLDRLAQELAGDRAKTGSWDRARRRFMSRNERTHPSTMRAVQQRAEQIHLVNVERNRREGARRGWATRQARQSTLRQAATLSALETVIEYARQGDRFGGVLDSRINVAYVDPNTGQPVRAQVYMPLPPGMNAAAQRAAVAHAILSTQDKQDYEARKALISAIAEGEIWIEGPGDFEP